MVAVLHTQAELAEQQVRVVTRAIPPVPSMAFRAAVVAVVDTAQVVAAVDATESMRVMAAVAVVVAATWKLILSRLRIQTCQ